MKREPRSEQYGIVDCKVVITWNDGQIEDLSPDLPEYLAEEIERYLDELDDLRNCDPDDYNFSEPDQESMQIAELQAENNALKGGIKALKIATDNLKKVSSL